MSKEYTLEEVNELKAWFGQQEIPQSMTLDKAVFIPDLKETISHLLDQAYVCYKNPKLEGCLLLLERIKAKLENPEET